MDLVGGENLEQLREGKLWSEFVWEKNFSIKETRELAEFDSLWEKAWEFIFFYIFW